MLKTTGNLSANWISLLAIIIYEMNTFILFQREETNPSILLLQMFLWLLVGQEGFFQEMEVIIKWATEFLNLL